MKIPAFTQDATSGPDKPQKNAPSAQSDGRSGQAEPASAGQSDSLPPGPGYGPPHPPNRANDRRSHWRYWLTTPAGRYVLDWEQAHLDAAVANLFGFVAVQCGLREIDSLRQNRMRSRVLISRSDAAASYDDSYRPADVVIEHYEELPLAAESTDLVVLPHVLEFAADPHQVLREIDRVLRPDGRAIITGFNPVSLWGIGQSVGRLLSRPPLPPDEHFIGVPRLRDWCKLLSFEIEAGSYGCYRPLVASDKWLRRTNFLEKAGDRWWPICGAVYSVTVVKRVRGMRLLGPQWKSRGHRARGVAVASPTFAPSSIHARPGADYDSSLSTNLEGVCAPWPNLSKSSLTGHARETPDQAAGER